jgi:adenosylcobinamide amidohydrolase
VKFGSFYEHQIPRPWSERSEYEVFQNSLAQIELAEADVLGRRLELEEVDTEASQVSARQNEDIVRLTAAELKEKMALKEAARRPDA